MDSGGWIPREAREGETLNAQVFFGTDPGMGMIWGTDWEGSKHMSKAVWFSLQVYTDSTGNCVTIIQGRVGPLLTGLKLVLVYGRSNSTGETNLGKYQSGESMPFSVQGTEVNYFCSPRIRFSVTLCLSYSNLSRQHFFPRNLTNQDILGV